MSDATAILCGIVLIIAAVMEIVSFTNGRYLTKYGMILVAFGFLMLGTRYFYLFSIGELGRLNIYGTGSVGAIALGRIIFCASELRK